MIWQNAISYLTLQHKYDILISTHDPICNVASSVLFLTMSIVYAGSAQSVSYGRVFF